MKLTKDTPRLEEAVAFHNGVTQWTICNIMKEFTAAKRADVIVKFIDVAMVCVCVSVCICILMYYSIPYSGLFQRVFIFQTQCVPTTD